MTVRVLSGHCLDILRGLPDESADMCVTSPPFWGLRDYGTPPLIWGGTPECLHLFGPLSSRHRGGPPGGSEINEGRDRSAQAETADIETGAFCVACGAWRGSLGLEPTPELYVAHLVEIFREVRRVLHREGTLWLNLGDCYATGAGKVGERPGGGEQGDRWAGDGGGTPARCNGSDPGKRVKLGPMTQPNRMPIAGLKAKDLVGIPWRVAFALQADGWWLRSDIIWAKRNGMPESVTDRCTKSHEYLFMLAKSEHYYFDSTAIEEPQEEAERARRLREAEEGLTSRYETKLIEGVHGQHPPGANGVARSVEARHRLALKGTRNKRTVWSLPTAVFEEAHFATFPPALVEPCIAAGTSEHGHCTACGTGWERVVVREPAAGEKSGNKERAPASARGVPQDAINGGNQCGSVPFTPSAARTIGWRPSCSCAPPTIRRPVVLDICAGAGTTGLVADRMGRDALLIELSADYCGMIERRIRGDSPLFAQVEVER